jgi:hypothetical protein
VDDETHPKRQTHWGLKQFCEICSGASLRTMQRVFNPRESWLERRPNPFGGKQEVGAEQSSISAKWEAHTAEVGEHNTISAETRWRVSGD